MNILVSHTAPLLHLPLLLLMMRRPLQAPAAAAACCLSAAVPLAALAARWLIDALVSAVLALLLMSLHDCDKAGPP